MGDVLGLIGSGLGILGGVLGNIGANDTAQAIAAQTNQTNRDIMAMQGEQAYSNAAEADARTRALYSDLYGPAAKAKQLREAGLSVGLMYGQGGAGGSGTAGAQAQLAQAIPSVGAENRAVFDAQLGLMAADAMKKAAETENIKADTANKNANLPLIEQTTQLVTQQTENAKKENEKLTQEIKNLTEQQLLIAEQRNDTKRAAELKEAQKNLIETQNSIAKIDLSYEDELKYWQVAEMQEQYEKLFQEARKLGIEADKMEEYINQQIKLMAAQALQAKANAAKTEKEKELINEQIRQIERSNNIEKELDDIFDGPDDKKGVGGAVRRFGKTIWKMYQDYKQTQKQPYYR